MITVDAEWVDQLPLGGRMAITYWLHGVPRREGYRHNPQDIPEVMAVRFDPHDPDHGELLLAPDDPDVEHLDWVPTRWERPFPTAFLTTDQLSESETP